MNKSFISCSESEFKYSIEEQKISLCEDSHSFFVKGPKYIIKLISEHFKTSKLQIKIYS